MVSYSAGSFRGTSECPLGKFLHQTLLVFRRTAQVGTGLRFIGGKLRGLGDGLRVQLLPAQEQFGFSGFDGSGTDVGQANSNFGACAGRVERHLSGNGGGREIADLALQLEVRASASRRGNGNANLGQDLIVFERCGEDRQKEILNRDDSRTVGARGDYFGSEREHGGSMIVGWIAVRQVSTDGGEISHLRIGDHPAGIVDHRILRADQV